MEIIKKVIKRFSGHQYSFNCRNHDSYKQQVSQQTDGLRRTLHNPYDNIVQYKPIKVTKIRKDYKPPFHIPFSMISPVKNEAESIAEFIKSIENQTVLPQEYIIVDGGSTDDTVKIINQLKTTSKLNIKLYEIKSKSISEQRNLAIESAINEYIVLADAGNVLDVNYCANLIGAFQEYPDADLVGAIYYALHDECAKYFIYDWNSFDDWEKFLPAGKTMAIKKSKALEVGAFPEYLAYAGEDALFDINYRRKSQHWVFNLNSFVYWDIPRDEEATYRKFKSYGIGSGESSTDDYRFYEPLMRMRFNDNYNESNLILQALFMGYLKGREKRSEIEFNKRNVNGVSIIFTSKHLHNSSQLQKLVSDSINEKRKVILVSTSTKNIEPKFYDMDYTLLELYNAGDFTFEDFWRRYGEYKEKVVALIDNEALTDLNISNNINIIKNIGIEIRQVLTSS